VTAFELFLYYISFTCSSPPNVLPPSAPYPEETGTLPKGPLTPRYQEGVLFCTYSLLVSGSGKLEALKGAKYPKNGPGGKGGGAQAKVGGRGVNIDARCHLRIDEVVIPRGVEIGAVICKLNHDQ